MADKPLKSIKFPGLSDTYTVPEIDSTLSTTGQAADAKAVGDELTQLKTDLEDITDILWSDVNIDITASTSKKIYISSNNKWNANNNSLGYFVPIIQGADALNIKANDAKSTVLAFLQDDSAVTGTIPNYCQGQDGRIVISSNIAQSFSIPQDCAYVWFLSKSSSESGFLPATATFSITKEIVDIDATLSVSGDAADAKATGDAIADLNARFLADFVLPKKMYMVGGIEYNVYHQNILRNFNTQTAYSIETTTNFSDYIGFSRLSPATSASQTNKGAKFRLYPFNGNYFLSSDTFGYDIVPSTAGSGLTKKILLIGDSLTFNQPLSKHLVDDLLANDVMSVSLIGTLGTAPYLREGRSGWSPHDYVSGYEHEDSFTNAFWNPSTAKFDFSYYMNNNGFTGVDYVFINLGTNLGDGNTPESMVQDLSEMITSIHAYDENIRIGVWTPPPRGIIGQGFLTNNDNTLTRVKAILDEFEGKQSQRVYVVPVTLNVDPYHDFPTETVNVSRRDTNFQMVVATDRTHPSDAGYFKMADVIYGYIKYFGSLDT